MNSHEVLILFTAVVVLSALTAYVLGNAVRSGLESGDTVAANVRKQASTEFQVLSVYGNATETNVVVKGVSGSVSVKSLVVLVDGAPVSVTASVPVRDEQNNFTLEPGDVYILRTSAVFDDSNCIRVVSAYAEDIYGVCT